MNNFDFLKEPFLDWLKEKKKDIEEFQNFNLAQNAKEILDYNDIDIFELLNLEDRILKYLFFCSLTTEKYMTMYIHG